jgi:hypothetical protein
MIELAQSEPMVPVLPNDLDKDPMLLNCQNGVLALRTGTLLPHSRNYLMTKIVATDYLPDKDCPTWKLFLERIFNGNTCERKCNRDPLTDKQKGPTLVKKSVPLPVWGFQLIPEPEIKRGHSFAVGLIPEEQG